MFKFFSIFIFVFSFCLCAKTSEEKEFTPFTGKILGNKVRLRCKPDLESHVIKQYNKNDFVLVLKDLSDFWAISPSKETKAYVYRSYVLDNVIEADRVNIRLFPDVNAPIIGRLQKGEKLKGEIYTSNTKWLEIDLPQDTYFYISKEFVEYFAPKTSYETVEKRKKTADEILENVYTIYQEESKTPFEQINPKNVIDPLENLIRKYSDLPGIAIKSKNLLSEFQEVYLNKKLAYLEENSTSSKKIITTSDPFTKLDNLKNIEIPDVIQKKAISKKTPFSNWENSEQALYSNWLSYNQKKTLEDFYFEQKANSVLIRGKLERYSSIVQNCPGDFIVKDSENTPIAFVYSTKMKLENWIGKEVSLLVSPRPNNHFAYPAYYVLKLH